MHKKQHKAIPNLEHEDSDAHQRDFNWENIKVFLAVARTNSFRAATNELGISLNTVRRRIDTLEHEASCVLFIRHANGVALTDEGEVLFKAARAMEAASMSVRRATTPNTKNLSGQVNLTVTEGLGTFWLLPRVVELQRNYPMMSINLQCQMRPANIARMESDLSIQLDRPDNLDLKIKKLGNLHLMPFASTKYLDIYGRPKSMLDYRNHKFVIQVADQVHSNLFDKAFPKILYRKFISIKTNTSSSHFWAICQGAGVGFLPTYASFISNDVEPIDIGLNLHRDIWLVYHPDARKIRRVSILIDQIIQMFNHKSFPWFSNHFIHPHEIKKMSNYSQSTTGFVNYPERN